MCNESGKLPQQPLSSCQNTARQPLNMRVVSQKGIPEILEPKIIMIVTRYF
jgi:hypothetical protein